MGEVSEAFWERDDGSRFREIAQQANKIVEAVGIGAKAAAQKYTLSERLYKPESKGPSRCPSIFRNACTGSPLLLLSLLEM